MKIDYSGIVKSLREYVYAGGADLTKAYYYLAGPMSNLPGLNFAEFDRIAAALRQTGMNLLNPAELSTEQERRDAEENKDITVEYDEELWKECLRRDIGYVINPNCVGVICLEGWENSLGARVETYNAEMLGLPIYKYNGPLEEIKRSDYLKGSDVRFNH